MNFKPKEIHNDNKAGMKQIILTLLIISNSNSRPPDNAALGRTV